MNNNVKKQNRWKGLVLGAAGGVAGLWAMRLYWQKIAPRLSESVDLGGTDVYPDDGELDDISMVERRRDREESSTAVTVSEPFAVTRGRLNYPRESL